jgi:hypothetical protein
VHSQTGERRRDCNRFNEEPDFVSDAEQARIAALFGASSLDVPLASLADVGTHARLYCGVLLKSPGFLLAGVAPPDQKPLPRLVVADASYPILCKFLSLEILDPLTWNVQCSDGSLTVARR